jgi:hypothetical protein
VSSPDGLIVKLSVAVVSVTWTTSNALTTGTTGAPSICA